MSGYHYYEPMNLNTTPYGYATQPVYPPLLYAHDPSVHVNDNSGIHGSIIFDNSYASESAPYLSSSSDEMDSDLEDSDQVHEPLPSFYETEESLRDFLKIPQEKPLNLYSLPECLDPNDPEMRPTTIALAALAIWGSDSKRLTLKQIITAVEERYPTWAWFDPNPRAKAAWKSSIRHSLTLKACFIHERREGSTNKKGGFWHLNVAYGYGDTRDRKRARPQGSESSGPHSHPSSSPSPASKHESSITTAQMLNGLDNQQVSAGSHDVVTYGTPQATNAQAYQYFGVPSPQSDAHNYANYQQAPVPAPNSYIFVEEPYPQTANGGIRRTNLQRHAYLDLMQPVNATNMSQGSTSGRQSTERNARALGRQMPRNASKTRRTM